MPKSPTRPNFAVDRHKPAPPAPNRRAARGKAEMVRDAAIKGLKTVMGGRGR